MTIAIRRYFERILREWLQRGWGVINLVLLHHGGTEVTRPGENIGICTRSCKRTI
jgi:hypothetical protein